MGFLNHVIRLGLLQFVARYSDNNLDGEQLAGVYTKISRGHGVEKNPALSPSSLPARPDTVGHDEERRGSNAEVSPCFSTYTIKCPALACSAQVVD